MSAKPKKAAKPAEESPAEVPAVVEEPSTKHEARSTGDKVPPCPAADPAAGDKTPAVVAWWFEHHPEQALVRYQGRKFERPA